MKETTENKSKLESVVLKAEYQEILSTSISPSNILSFYEQALKRLIALTNKTVKKYTARNPKTPFVGKALEDAAYSEVGLQDVASTLDAIQQRQEQLHAFQLQIENELSVSEEVFVPPSDEHRFAIQVGSGRGLEEKLIFPRLLTLLYILENDLDIQATPSEEGEEEAVEVTKGSVVDSMMRSQPYVRIIIPELKRIVYLCDEEGNATFIFDQKAVEAQGISTNTLDTTDKAVFGELFEKHPELGVRIIYIKEKWRTDILEALNNDFVAGEERGKKSVQAQKPKSDFAQHVEVLKKKEGWESARSLTNVLYSSRDSIKTYSETFKPGHPEWFEKQKTGANEVEHYHPELVKLIIEYFESTPFKKDGWESARSLGKVVHSAPDAIKKYAETFKPGHPKWFENQVVGRSTKAEHYHPELVKLIVEYFKSIPLKREGWKSAESIRKIVLVANSTVQEYATTFKLSHPEWFEVQRTTTKAEHYHPELVKLILKHFESMLLKKEGWESAGSLQKILHSDFYVIKKYAETFKPGHPEWFEVQITSNNKAEHYHPELVKLIIKHFESMLPKKEGWGNSESLSKVVHSEALAVKTYAETFKPSHPEWFEVQKPIIKGRPSIHYHPELVRLIKEHFEKKRR